ncbi:MAG: phospholipid carrier-dependent glycosyltransferase [Deltaproteobacteria bacterium]|nr:phospholipid carrier-dependent glycosyltransferase [Deltaproteobacteria bacterium]
MTIREVLKNNLFYLAILVLTIISYFTHVHNYQNPKGFFWDENYHVPAAMKYLNNVFFREYHPPLGKLLIALGEYGYQTITGENQNVDIQPLLTTAYAKDIPDDFKFNGVRFFPVVFAWASVIVFFLILHVILQNTALAFAFSSLYAFENSIIVHFRGAMLDGIQMFFILLAILFFIRYSRLKEITAINFFCMGTCIGLSLATKVTGLVLVVLFPFLLYRVNSSFDYWLSREGVKHVICLALSSFAGIMMPFLLVWYVHFALGDHAADEQWYKASPEVQQIIKERKQASPINFYEQLIDTYRFFVQNNKGVPKLDVCKPGENGSTPFKWIIGGKSINYRWAKDGKGATRYLFLQVNPLILFISILALALSIILVGGRLFFGLPLKDADSFYFILPMLSIYLAYMGMMLNIERVMYLYHYFIPYMCTFVIAACLFKYIYSEYIQKADTFLYSVLALCYFGVFTVFLYYSPLTYYSPLRSQAVMARELFKEWQLKPIL